MSVRWYSINSYIECATCSAQYVLWGNRVMLFILSVRRAPLSFIFFLFVQYCISFPSSVQYDLLFILSVRRAPLSIVIFFSPSSAIRFAYIIIIINYYYIMCLNWAAVCSTQHWTWSFMFIMCFFAHL
jgi:hypothetical protein